MKRRLISALLVCLLLTSFLSVAAGDTPPTESGFQAVTIASGYESKVTLTPLTAAGNAVAADDGFYADAVKLKVEYNDAQTGAFYLIAALSDASGVPTKDNIQYIDQVTASGSTVSFTVYPKDLISGQTYSIYLSGSSTDFTALTKVAEFTYYVPYTPGDVDGVTGISANDALFILQAVAHMRTLGANETLAANVDGVAGISANDALYVLQAVAHMRTLG